MGELDWHHAISGIPAAGLAQSRQATAAERDAVAKALGLLSLAKLSADYRITKLAGDGYRLAGRLNGELEQACVVSLDPVAQTIDETFDAEFRAHVDERTAGSDATILGGPDQEPIENGEIDAGRIVFETLSAALDPYVRKEGAEFMWQDKSQADTGKVSPFAVLAKLKNKA